MKWIENNSNNTCHTYRCVHRLQTANIQQKSTVQRQTENKIRKEQTEYCELVLNVVLTHAVL